MPKQRDRREDVTSRSMLNLRIKSEDKILIDRAASATGKNRTEFILEAARRAAEEMLADLRMIDISPEMYQLFIDQLDMPPQTNEVLRKTMRSQSPWDN